VEEPQAGLAGRPYNVEALARADVNGVLFRLGGGSEPPPPLWWSLLRLDRRASRLVSGPGRCTAEVGSGTSWTLDAHFTMRVYTHTLAGQQETAAGP
jgi:hypothetical protein